MIWPANLLDPSYAPAVLHAVSTGGYELAWAPVVSGPVTVLVSARPLRIEGVFVNVSATLQQQVADALGALLPTPKIMDLAWLARAATLLPVTLPVAATSDAMIQASARLDAEIAAAGSPAGVLVCQKTWAIGNSLQQHPGRAMNYGDFVLPNQAGNKWNGIATEACVSIPAPAQGRVIQGQGWVHTPDHLDYSQLGTFVHRSCTVDGASADLRDVLTDKTLASYVSHEGALTLPQLRQPGVALYACSTAHVQTAFAVPASAVTEGMCPTPPAPVTAPAAPRTGAAVGLAATALAALAAWWWAVEPRPAR